MKGYISNIWKRTLSLLLALTMILPLCVPALAYGVELKILTTKLPTPVQVGADVDGLIMTNYSGAWVKDGLDLIVTEGSLPQGLVLSNDGWLHGSPTKAGTYTFTVTLKGKGSYEGQTDSKTYTMTVEPAIQPAAYITEMTVDTYVGGTAESNLSGTPHKESFFANSYTENGKLIPEKTIYGFKVTAKGSDPSKKVLIWAGTRNSTESKFGKEYNVFNASGAGSVTHSWTKFDETIPDQTIYFHAQVEGSEFQYIISCSVKHATRAAENSNIRWIRRGIQVRGFKINDQIVSFGTDNYFYHKDKGGSSYGSDAIETDGPYAVWPMWTGESTVKDTNGKERPLNLKAPDTVWGTGEYEECFFPIIFTDDGNAGEPATATGPSNEELANLYANMAKWVLPVKEKYPELDFTAPTITLFGPAIIECYNGAKGNGLKGGIYYNLAYFPAASGVDLPNKSPAEYYSGWAENADFKVRNYQEYIVNNIFSGNVTINYRDSSTGALLTGELDKATNKGKVVAGGKELTFAEKADINRGMAQVESDRDADNYRLIRMGENTDLSPFYGSDAKAQRTETYNLLKAGATTVTNDLFSSHLSFYTTPDDPEDKPELDETKKELTDALQAYADTRNDFIWNIISGKSATGGKNETAAPLNTRKIVKPAELEGYVFEYALGKDGANEADYGALMAGPTAKEIYVLANANDPNPVIDLYYRAANRPGYRVKIRLDGKIDETLTRTYPVQFDEEDKPLPVPENDSTIEKSMELIPDDYTPVGIVQGPDEGPMPLNPDPEHPERNVIIIDCKSGNSYTVKVRVGGQIVNQQTYFEHPVTGDKLKQGDVITEGNIDKSLAGEYEIKQILNAQSGETPLADKPLELSKAPKTNVIIIDCEENECKYHVYYYTTDNKQLDHYEGAGHKDEVVYAEMRDYDGYKWDHSEGEPLTLRDNKGVIKVYYVRKTSTQDNAYGELKLYTDANYTFLAPKEYHSGYGFWATYEVTVPEWLYNFVVLKQQKTDAYGNVGPVLQTFNYQHSPSHCPPRAQRGSKQVCTYCDINWTVEFKWTDGMGTDNKIIAKGNGRNVDVKTTSKNGVITDNGGKGPQLNYELSKKRHKLVFTLPNNYGPQKLPKAYIPVATKDGNNWKINASFQYTYKIWNEKPVYSTESCPGHTVLGLYTWYHQPTSYRWKREDSRNWDSKGPVNGAANASIKVNGNMYQDDFTGGKK